MVQPLLPYILPQPEGKTVLDKVHKQDIYFAAGISVRGIGGEGMAGNLLLVSGILNNPKLLDSVLESNS
jgi:hypothetical protein